MTRTAASRVDRGITFKSARFENARGLALREADNYGRRDFAVLTAAACLSLSQYAQRRFRARRERSRGEESRRANCSRSEPRYLLAFRRVHIDVRRRRLEGIPTFTTYTLKPVFSPCDSRRSSEMHCRSRINFTVQIASLNAYGKTKRI